MLSRLCRSLVLRSDKQMAKFTARRLRSKALSYDEIPLQTTERDDYFAVVHHVTHIVHCDFYMEWTLNKTRPVVDVRPCVQSMWKVIHEIKNQNLGLSAEAVCGIIEEFGRQGLTDQAVEVFNKCRNFDCVQTVEVYNSVLFSLCAVKMFHGAYALIERGRSGKRSFLIKEFVSSVLVNGWRSSDKMREAQEFLEDMSRKGFNPPVRGRDLLIESLLNAGYLESAKEMVRKMTKEGFVPVIDTFNSLMEAVSKSGEIDFCLSLHYKTCVLGLCPDINTYKLLIPPVSEAGLIEEALKLLNNSVEVRHRPFPSLYAPIIKGMCRRGQFDEAFSFFREMKMKGHPPNRPVYTMLITTCGRQLLGGDDGVRIRSYFSMLRHRY